jgi:monofunctional biosynthetic peptidoglycan transglycosylase
LKVRWPLAAALLAPAGLAALSISLSPRTYRDIASLDRRAPEVTALMRIRERQALRKHKSFEPERRWVPLERISVNLQHAVIAAEDGGFYRHGGVEWGLIREALIYDLKQRRWARGASTITQQLVKNLYLSPSKNPFRKSKEIILALRVENRLTKDRILELYLNCAEWGPGVFGAEAAAWHYFGKPASVLTEDEAVALAAVLPSPRRHDPRGGSAWVEQRKAWVRRRLRAVWGEPKPLPAPGAAPIEPAVEESAERPPDEPAEDAEEEVDLETDQAVQTAPVSTQKN